MVIITERSFQLNQEIKSVKEAVECFDYIKQRFNLINTILSGLNLIFIRTDWYIREGYSSSLKIYQDTVNDMRIELDHLEKAIVCLNDFILSEKAKEDKVKKGIPLNRDEIGQPIPVNSTTSQRISRFVTSIKDKLIEYKQEITRNRKLVLPMPLDEIERCHKSIHKINEIIADINTINVRRYRKESIPLIVDLDINF